MAFVGGLFNIIDRATQSPPNPNTVIDYLDTSFIFNTISNFPDVFILTGIISFTVLYVTMSVITITKEKRRITKSKDNNPTHEKNHS
jgi:lipoprotein signal peptidase